MNYKNLHFVSVKNSGADFREGKRSVRQDRITGRLFDVCATFNKKYICCRVYVLRSVQNCPYECSYCFLQNYLTDGQMKYIDDLESLLKEVYQKTEAQPWRLFRIGTWELGDSLALERRTGQAVYLIKQFSHIENAVLELKTKSDVVDDILNLDHNSHTVVSWSQNTDYISRTEEHGTAPLERRLIAMKKVFEAGYLIGLHFDPMILYDGWQRDYSQLIRDIFSYISAERIAWISIGSLRFNPEMKRMIEIHYPHTGVTSQEMITGDDGKMRYVKPLRLEMYRHLYRELKNHIREDTLVYLCMERWDVWERIFGYYPESSAHLDYIFAKSLYERFGLGIMPPEKVSYDATEI